MKTIIWTRSISDWDEDKSHFGSEANAVIRIPCINIVERPNPRLLPGSKITHCVITSANAARFSIKNLEVLKLLRSAREVYTHGKTTSEILKAAGVKTKHVDVKSAKALGEFLLKTLPPGSRLLWPCGEEVAYDFSLDLLSSGFKVQRLVLYETRQEVTSLSGRPMSKEKIAELVESLSGNICFASPSATKCFAQTFSVASNRLGTELRAFVIGPTTEVEAKKFFKNVETISEATLGTLVASAVA